MRSTAPPSLPLCLAVGWGALWGTRTLGVHSLAAFRATAVSGYLHVAMAVLGAIAVLTGAKALRGSLTARAMLVVALVVFVVAELPGVLAGAPLDVAAALAHVVAAVGVRRAAPSVYATARTRSGVGLD